MARPIHTTLASILNIAAGRIPEGLIWRRHPTSIEGARRSTTISTPPLPFSRVQRRRTTIVGDHVNSPVYHWPWAGDSYPR